MKNSLLMAALVLADFGCSQADKATNESTNSLQAKTVNSEGIEAKTQVKNQSNKIKASSTYTMNSLALTDPNDIIHLPDVEKVLLANSDFTLHEQNSSNAIFYDDPKTDSLGIDAANLDFRTQYAIASYTLGAEEEGDFELGFVSLSEFDGESHYKLFLNDKLVGDFTNPRTELDFHEVYFKTGKVFSLQAGDEIKVEAIVASNGLIPEDGGYAWARGRWRAVTLLSIE
ncbi:hypothetical protein [Colwellia sp. C1TZA3]|uniref:hypothetical protein n=1 Tax=Colwellia sp. C1TZA3 TaxID=2508879 RepID=UPI0011B95132|nr:hypothetical protein [Colwellia sp. C1TZA3]TWX69082.1 hypothetical protein ESZ39_11930 [Colwellia sp. C1TZA3]